MSISTTPPPAPPKKKGMGCLGCGCLILVILLILLLGLVGGATYLGYNKLVSLTSTTAADVPNANTGDDVFNTARQKLTDFDHDIKNHQAATIQLNGDEINALIARDPDVIRNNIHAYVTLTSSEGRVQASFPTDALSHGFIKGRYINFDASFAINFDSQTRNINIVFHSAQLGSRVVLGPNADNDQTSQAFMRSFTPAFNQSFNNAIRQNADGAALLDQAKSIEIKDGQLVIITQ